MCVCMYDIWCLCMYADVIATEFNMLVVEGKCESVRSFFLLVGRFDVSEVCRYMCVCVCVCVCADVLDTEFNTSVVEGKCKLLVLSSSGVEIWCV